MKNIETVRVTRSYFLGFFGWLGGAVYVYHQPEYGFWDALIWLYYVGRYIAHNYTILPPI